MKDQMKTKKQLINELMELRQRITEFEAFEKERKGAEAALKESDERFRELFDNAPVGYHEFDIEGRITRVNRTELNMLGYTSQEMLGRPIWKFIMEEEKSRQSVTGKLARRIPPSKFLRRTFRRKDGMPVLASIEEQLLRDSEGKIVGIRSTIQDITEQNRVEEALRQSEERYRTLVEESFDGIFVQKGNKIIFANQRLSEILGYDKGQLEGLDHWLVYHPDYQKLTRERAQARMRGVEVPSQYEVKLRRKDGSSFDGEINARKIMFGNDPGIQVWVRDITERKQAEDALRESEERYRTILDNIVDGYFEVDIAGNFTFFNDSVCRILGYSRDELMGANNPMYTDPENSKKLYQAFNKVYRTGEPTKEFNWEVIRKGGTKRVGEVSISLIKDSEGKPIGFRGIARDITERKRLEENLEKEQQELKLIIDSSPIIVFYKDKEGRFKRVNKTFSEALKMPEEDFVGKTVFNLYSPEIAQGMTDDDHEVLKSGRPKLNVIERYESASGIRWVQTDKVPIFDKNGIPVGLIGFAQDITERKQAEEALQRSEEEAKRLAQENAIVAEIGRVISATLNIEEVYEHFAVEVNKLTPFDRIAINIINPKKRTATIAYTIGVDVTDRQPGDTFPLAGSYTEEVIRTRSGLLIQAEEIDELKTQYPGLLTSFQAGLRSMMLVPLMSKDQVIGSLHIRSLKLNAYTESDLRLAKRVGNQIAGAIANAQLFAEHEHSEKERAVLQEQLRQSQKMEAIGRLAGGIAHDFNNLLTAISGNCELSLLELEEGNLLRGNLEEIKKAADRATVLTRQLLAFSRRQILEFKVLDLNKVILDLEKMLHRVIGEDIELVTFLAEDLGKIKTDPGQVEQVVMNLAVNARDAMPNGGKLTIETANVELDEAYAHTHLGAKPGRYVRLSLSDTGVGISSEVREQVFEPFFTTKEKGKGTGLGLSTVYGIVKQSGGYIGVYSELGHGTTFKIYLPRVDEPVEVLGEGVKGEEVPFGRETILLVEDEESVRKFAVSTLRRLGYEVLEASRGEEALSVCERHEGPVHMTVTDVVMPGMSGRELAEKLLVLRPEMKVLYMSGYTDDTIVRHGVLEKGVNYIQKPFSMEVLAKKVREVLEKDLKLVF